MEKPARYQVVDEQTIVQNECYLLENHCTGLFTVTQRFRPKWKNKHQQSYPNAEQYKWRKVDRARSPCVQKNNRHTKRVSQEDRKAFQLLVYPILQKLVNHLIAEEADRDQH